MHRSYLDTQGAVRFELGCGRAYVNLMSFDRHIRYGRCKAAATPPLALVDASDSYDCAVYDTTFDSRSTFIAHFSPENSPSGNKISAHAMCLLDKGLLWDCAKDWISVSEFFPLQTSTGLLQAISRLSSCHRKLHLTSVWRQSKYLNKEYTRIHRGFHIETSRRLGK